MPAPRYARVIMLGTAFDTRGGIAAVVNTYRAQGLFERWPIEYIATHCDGSPVGKLVKIYEALGVERRGGAAGRREPWPVREAA